jgi:hypothetical protein
LSLF